MDIAHGSTVTDQSDTSAAARDIVVIGASAGALAALETIVGALPADFPGVLFVVVHMSAEAKSSLAQILGRSSRVPVVAPDDRTPIQPRMVYVASADRHMLLERNDIRIVRGPRENRHRPAIDPLFRSAAWAFGPRVVGIVLTGYLDDGAAGLWAVKSCGGTTVVQDPDDAQYPDMPNNALTFNDVDYCLPLADIGPLITRLATERIPSAELPRRRASLDEESEFTIMEDKNIRDMAGLGKLSPYTCPSCRGALWELRDGDILRYRCHTGHAFSSESLLLDQDEDIERSLYAALRAVEERATLLRRLSQEWRDRYPRIEADYARQAAELERSADVLRQLLAASAG